MLFLDRKEAGQMLAEKLMHYANNPSVLVLALPRGGVPVAAEVAKALDAPLDVFVVRKLGLTGYEEMAIGAIAPGGIRVLDTDMIEQLGVPDDALEAIEERELEELRRRERVYRGDRPAASIIGQTVILVDDGVATGFTVRAAIVALRARRPARIILATPVAPPSTIRKLSREADEVVCVAAREDFSAVGEWYDDFRPTTDEEVIHLLESADLRVSLQAT